MLNVYSHLVDPPAFISSLKGLLSKRGQILIETGDTAYLAARKHPRPLYLPDHVSFASEKIVAGIIERVGFEVCETRKYADMVFDPIRIVKEGVKTVWPGRKSYLRHYLRKGAYVRRDMFILAKLRAAR